MNRIKIKCEDCGHEIDVTDIVEKNKKFIIESIEAIIEKNKNGK